MTVGFSVLSSINGSYETHGCKSSSLSCVHLTKQDRVFVNCTRPRVKTKSRLTNLVKISRFEGYNGKYRSNPQGIREIYDDLFEFDQIGR